MQHAEDQVPPSKTGFYLFLLSQFLLAVALFSFFYVDLSPWNRDIFRVLPDVVVPAYEPSNPLRFLTIPFLFLGLFLFILSLLKMKQISLDKEIE